MSFGMAALVKIVCIFISKFISLKWLYKEIFHNYYFVGKQ